MNTKKTIIHFSQDFTKGKPQLGGFSRIYNLCLDANEHIIYTISTEISDIEDYNLGAIKIVQIPVKKRPVGLITQLATYKSIANKIVKHIAENNIDAYLFFGHSHRGNFLILNYLRNQYYKNKKIIWEANVIGGSPFLKGNIKQMLENRFQFLLQWYVFKKADVIIAQTIMSSNYIKKEFKIENVNKIKVVPNAIHVAKEEQITEKKYDTNNIKILCFGLFDELNGIPFLINILKKHTFKNIHFDFAGYGKYHEQVRNTSNESEHVNYIGQLKHDQMLKQLPNYDYFIIPRINSLGSQLYIPTKLLEGMSLGVVPICSSVTGITIVVKNNEHGFIFEKNNEGDLIKVLKKLSNINQIDYLALSQNSKKLVNNQYDWKHNYIKLENIYNSV